MQAAYSGDTLLSVCAVIANKLQCRKMWFCFPPVLGERRDAAPSAPTGDELQNRSNTAVGATGQCRGCSAACTWEHPPPMAQAESQMSPSSRADPASRTPHTAHLLRLCLWAAACTLTEGSLERQGEGAGPERPASPSTSLVVTLPKSQKLFAFDFHYIKSIPHKFLYVLHTHHLLSSLADS